MPGKPLTAEQNECVRAHLRDLLKLRNGSQSEVARELGVSQPTISSVLSGRQGAGYYLVERIAKALGRDEREVLGKMPGRGPALPKAGRDARNFAAELARQHGVHEEAIGSVMDEVIQPGAEEQSVLWWTDRMRWRERELLGAPPSSRRMEAPAPAEVRRLRPKRCAPKR